MFWNILCGSNLRRAGATADEVAVETLEGVGEAEVVGALEPDAVEASGLDEAGSVPKALAGAWFVGGGVDEDPFTKGVPAAGVALDGVGDALASTEPKLSDGAVGGKKDGQNLGVDWSESMGWSGPLTGSMGRGNPPGDAYAILHGNSARESARLARV